MKKFIATLFCGLMLCCAAIGVVGCNNTNTKGDKISVVCTIFPQYDWVKQIVCDTDSVELTQLVDNGVDLHSFQPSVEDIAEISTCDLFIYVGGESDEWVENALKNATNKNMKVINLVKTLGSSVKLEEEVDGMQHDHDHNHEHGEIRAADIKDRTLAEFSGEWKSLQPLLVNGDLAEYCEHLAEDDGDETTTADTYLQKYATAWACDAVKISIIGKNITYTYSDGSTKSADYEYEKCIIKTDVDGDITGVRYQFKTADTDAPTYVQFNDHAYAPTANVEHFHVYFGNSENELTNSDANPYFMPDNLTKDEIVEELLGREHEYGEVDEHVWLSLKNAAVLSRDIANKLSEIDADNKSAYSSNIMSYISKLNELDYEYHKATRNATKKTVLFGDRFPFRYLVDDYGLSYYAAFVGCSAETEASFETISFLANKVDELGLTAILTIEGADHSIAETVKNNTTNKNQIILTMNSMQSVTADDVKKGTTYLSVMESNLDVLKQAIL